MKKLLLILICLFVSFEVKSKEVIFDCNGKRVLKYYEKIDKVEENYNIIIYLNERKKYLGYLSSKYRKKSRETKSGKYHLKLIKKYFRKRNFKNIQNLSK